DKRRGPLIPVDLAERLPSRGEFEGSQPFPHCVVEDLLGERGDELVAAFPGLEWEGWKRYPDRYQEGKAICSDIAAIPPPLADLIFALSSPAVLRALEELSGIEHLLPDPYLEGGGLHASGPGGILVPHTDFHRYAQLDLYRRLNLLVYLNPGWEESSGGALELFAPGMETPGRRVVPRLGTCVIFRTDARSPHGFTVPVAAGCWRRSVALYYYTSAEATSYSGDTNTYWRPVAPRTGVEKGRQALYKTLIAGSRALGMLAHRADPNLGGSRGPKAES
ncbi:MAG: 2OG-Fe(II) oxygenase, partial [Acidimicrobiales bacterium]